MYLLLYCWDTSICVRASFRFPSFRVIRIWCDIQLRNERIQISGTVHIVHPFLRLLNSPWYLFASVSEEFSSVLWRSRGDELEDMIHAEFRLQDGSIAAHDYYQDNQRQVRTWTNRNKSYLFSPSQGQWQTQWCQVSLWLACTSVSTGWSAKNVLRQGSSERTSILSAALLTL